MKRQTKFITAPLNIWVHPDLSVFERVVLIDIDSYCTSDMGAQIGAQTIATSIGLPVKIVKETLKSLKEKTAISVNIGENGETFIKPYLYKERYVANPNEISIGDKPSDIEIDQIDYEEVAAKWNEILPNMPQISRWTPLRKKKLKSVLKQADITIQDLFKCFKIISATAFLRGENDRKWQATFNWILGSSNNVLKILEGCYAKSYQEKCDFDKIMSGHDISKHQEDKEMYR